MNANEDKYLDDVLNLEDKLKKNENVLYDASSFNSFKVHVSVCDTEEILEDATKSQIKMENKLKDPVAIEKKQNFRPDDYKKLNALYETFFPQVELSAEQKYFPFVSITSGTPSNASTSSSPPATMPKSSKIMKHFHRMERDFEKLFTLLKTTSTPKSIFFTSKEDTLLNYFCCKEVKPILNELHSFIKIIQKWFLEEIKTIMNVFELMESDLDATWKQNEILNDQLLDVTLKYDVEKCVLICSDFVNDNSLDEIEKVKREFLKTQGEIDELIEHVNQKTYAYGDVRAQNQDLLITISELKARLKNVEKVTLQTSSTKKKQSVQNNNVIATGMYKVNTVHKQEICTQKAESGLTSTRLKDVISVRRPSSRSSSSKNSVLSNTKKNSEEVEVHVKINKKTNVASKKNLVQNKKFVTNVDVKNSPKAKDVFYVSCDKNVLTPCHDKCFAKYKLNMHSNVRRSLFTTPRTTKSKSLDTTLVVAKTSGCSKHMTGDLSLLKFFVEKFMGTIRFGNDHFAAITLYDDYVHENITICHVYYVEGLGHNLFSVGQFCDGVRESNFYTISISDMAASSRVCLMSKATLTKLWLWHRRLSHLNFGIINDLTKQDLVDGLPKFKYDKDHLCSACERGKTKKATHPSKMVPSTHSKLELIHIDLCGPMRVESINGKKYSLVIVDDYSRYTWVYFLRTKDEALDMIKKFIAQVQLNFHVLNSKVFE
ncbi:integrase, catalytic region, zinc finger, CCHC-type containing protein [Tanacetum coccineum]